MKKKELEQRIKELTKRLDKVSKVCAEFILNKSQHPFHDEWKDEPEGYWESCLEYDRVKKETVSKDKYDKLNQEKRECKKAYRRLKEDYDLIEISYSKNSVMYHKKRESNHAYWQSVIEMRAAQDLLMAEALRLNDGWVSKPDSDTPLWHFVYSNELGLRVDKSYNLYSADINFRKSVLANEALERLGEETIKTAIGKYLRYE